MPRAKTKDERIVAREDELNRLSVDALVARAAQHHIRLNSPYDAYDLQAIARLIRHVAQHDVAHEMMAEQERAFLAFEDTLHRWHAGKLEPREAVQRLEAMVGKPGVPDQLASTLARRCNNDETLRLLLEEVLAELEF